MTDTLLTAVDRYTAAQADREGYAYTTIPGLSTVRSTVPSGLMHGISHPIVCLVLQGRKQVTLGTETLTFGAGDSLLITADAPIVSQITHASAATPYLALAVDLDPAVIAELTVQMEAVPTADGTPIWIEPTDAEIADAALRLLRLLDRPGSLPVLHTQLTRELHYWLLQGRHGAAIRRLGLTESQPGRVARAVAVMRAGFAQSLRVDQLAAIAGMSPSSFFHHFRAATSLSPRQFQKRLRLIEARRLMMLAGSSASGAAFEVGYESVPQFTRDYGRMFGLPPVKDKAKWTRLSAREGRAATGKGDALFTWIVPFLS